MTGESPFVEPMYTAHAIQALRALGAMDGRGPDVFYLEAGDWGLEIHEPHLVRTWLGLDWPGRFIMHLVKPCPAADFCGDRLALAGAGAPPQPLAWVEAHPEAGIEYADESHMAYALLNDQVPRPAPARPLREQVRFAGSDAPRQSPAPNHHRRPAEARKRCCRASTITTRPAASAPAPHCLK